MISRLAAMIAFAAAGVAVWAGKRAAQPVQDATPDSLGTLPTLPTVDEASAPESAGINWPDLQWFTPNPADPATNVSAFLSMIARAEGTAKAADSYRVCFGNSHTIQNFNDHPCVTGEWAGKRLSDALCRAAGQQVNCISTAAGRYQFIKPTWQRLKRTANLPDFSPASQDRAAIRLLYENGAITLVQQGRFAEAVRAVAPVWASLPGAGYSQPERKLAELVSFYMAAGGQVTT